MSRTILLAALTLSHVVFADDSPAEISRKSRERGALNLVGLSAEMKLTSSTADGKSKEQVLTTTSRKIDGKSHALARFSAPAGVAGVAVLTIEGTPKDGDEVSLYLPKLKRVRKVARSDRGKAFMDTDFSYADIASNGIDDASIKRLENAKIDGRDCFVLTGPGDETSPYGTVTISIDTQTYVPMQIDYTDKAGKPLKRYRTLKLKTFKDRTLAAESLMENLQSGSKTSMAILKLEDSALGDDAFTERALERG